MTSRRDNGLVAFVFLLVPIAMTGVAWFVWRYAYRQTHSRIIAGGWALFTLVAQWVLSTHR